LCLFWYVKKIRAKPLRDTTDTITVNKKNLVEQFLHDMLKNCSDRMHARTPEKFSKLFKQTRQWRKYFLQIEKKLSSEVEKCHELTVKYQKIVHLKDQMELEQKKLTKQLDSFKTAKTTSLQKEEEKQKQQELLKKISKLKQRMSEQEEKFIQKTHELENLHQEFTRYRHTQRTKEMREALFGSPRNKRVTSPSSNTTKTCTTQNNNHLVVLTADNASLQNQLIRAESDNSFLLKALQISIQHQGTLPDLVQNELSRIKQRTIGSSTIKRSTTTTTAQPQLS
jgi:chromosome segregation ATPase